MKTGQWRTSALPPDPAASRATLPVGDGVGVGVFVGVVAHPARSPTVSRPKVRVAVVRGERFNRFPFIDSCGPTGCLEDPDRADAEFGPLIVFSLIPAGEELAASKPQIVL